ncbi:oxidoreductase [Fredinandcohnia humi]
MNKPVVIITGSSSGFGLLAAIEFSKQGYFVIATMRDLHKQEHILQRIELNTMEDHIRFAEVDVTNSNSLDSLKNILHDVGHVDVLINNAGFATGGFAEEVSLQEYKSQFETNFFGVIEITKLVLPFMRKQGNGKILNLSSISGQIGFPGLSPYVSSKFALEGWSECLRLEVNPFGIDVALIEPGSFQTNIWSSGKKVAEKSLLPSSPYHQIMKKIEAKLEKDKEKYGDPMEVVRLLVNLAEAPKLTKLRYPIGQGVKTGILLKSMVPWKIWEKFVLRAIGR